MLLTACPAGAGLQSPDIDSGWLVDAHRLDAFMATEGAGPAADRGYRIRLGSGRLHGMSALPMLAVGLDMHHRGRSMSIGWNRTGESLWREDSLYLELIPLSRLSPILRIDYVLGRCLDETISESLLPSLGARLLIGDVLHVQGRYDLPLARQDTGRRPLLGLDVRNGCWLAALHLDRVSRAAPSLRGSVNYRFSSAASVGVLVEPETSTWGYLLCVRKGRLLLRTSHLMHPALGVTHRLELTIGCGAKP
jgi:hypothetical protein